MMYMKDQRYPCLKALNGCYMIGPTGPKGDAAATITVNSTTTGLPNTQANVENSGTSSNVLLDFTIPTGKTGPAPKLSIGTVTTGLPGTNASVEIIPIQENERRL